MPQVHLDPCAVNSRKALAGLTQAIESSVQGAARFLGHSAFDHPDTPSDAPARESIEPRAIAFF